MPGFQLFSLAGWRPPAVAFGLLGALLSETSALAQSSDPVRVPFRRGSRWGYADHARRLVLPLTYDDAGPFVEDVAWVRLGARYGYINGSGQPVTPVQYSRAGSFAQGRATVELDGDVFDIGPDGQRLALPADPAPEADYLAQGDVVRQQGKLGFRFSVGATTVVPAAYDEIQDLHHDGLLLVRQGAKWGVLDAKGRLVLPLAYDAIRATAANGFAYPVVEQAGRYGYLAADGHLLTKVQYAAAEPFLADVARVTTPEGKSGYIDSRGREYFED